MNIKVKKSFTLTEIIVVVIILGVIASAAMVGYNKTMEQALARRAIMDLRAMAAAEEIFRARHGRYWPGDGNSDASHEIDEINTALGFNIIQDPRLYYDLVDTGALPFGSTFAVCARRQPSGSPPWWYRTSNIPGEDKPYCITPSCPITP